MKVFDDKWYTSLFVIFKHILEISWARRCTIHSAEVGWLFEKTLKWPCPRWHSQFWGRHWGLVVLVVADQNVMTRETDNLLYIISRDPNFIAVIMWHNAKIISAALVPPWTLHYLKQISTFLNLLLVQDVECLLLWIMACPQYHSGYPIVATFCAILIWVGPFNGIRWFVWVMVVWIWQILIKPARSVAHRMFSLCPFKERSVYENFGFRLMQRLCLDGYLCGVFSVDSHDPSIARICCKGGHA